MGFLNHATNNVIIDAVLTERGRELLSRNDGSFRIKSFSFGDDEVDYSLITKYGREVGKEKIEKNTPIFEANPNENIAIKYPLISFPNPLTNISEIPSFIRSDDRGSIGLVLGSDVEAELTSDFTIKSSVNKDSSFTVDPAIVDNFIFIKMHDRLLKMTTSEGVSLIDTDVNEIATYKMSTQTLTGANRDFNNQVSQTVEFTINGVVTASTFSNFSTVGDSNRINTTIQVIGASSGARILVPVEIRKPS